MEACFWACLWRIIQNELIKVGGPILTEDSIIPWVRVLDYLKKRKLRVRVWCFLTMDATWPDIVNSWGCHVISSLACHVTSHLNLLRHAAPAVTDCEPIQSLPSLGWLYQVFVSLPRDKQLIHGLLSTVLHNDHGSLARSRMSLLWQGLGKAFLSSFHSLWAQALEEHRT